MQDDLSISTTITDPKPESRYIIFGPYRCKVIFPNGQWGLFGRGGGVDALRGVQFYPPTDISRPDLVVGNYCDFASMMVLTLGGDHHNDNVINCVFAYLPIAKVVAGQAGEEVRMTYSKGPITIGSNVVISNNVTVLSGVTIGDGAVIGAGSVVTKDVPPYAIVAGNPARIIRYRVPEECIEDLLRIAWWNWSTTFIAQQMKAIHKMKPKEFISYCDELKPIPPADEDALLVLRMESGGGQRSMQFQGAEYGGRFFPIHQLPPRFLEYMRQMTTPLGGEVTVHPNLFSFLR